MSRNFRGRLSRLLSIRNSRRRRSRSRDSIGSLESLENRVLLSGGPTEYTVDLTSDTGASTAADAGDLRYVVSQANANSNSAGSQIEFDPSVFATPQTITLSSSMVLSEAPGPEMIDGPGASLVTIDANQKGTVLVVNRGTSASVSGLTVSHGWTFVGGGIVNDGVLTVANCTISYNVGASQGGGINNDGTLTVTDSTFYQNESLDGGAIYSSGGDVTLTGDAITANVAFGELGGSSPGKGGGIYVQAGSVTVNDDNIGGNSAAGGPGGMSAGGLNGYVGGSGEGGGLYVSGGTVAINSSTLEGDRALGGHGGQGGAGNAGWHGSCWELRTADVRNDRQRQRGDGPRGRARRQREHRRVGRPGGTRRQWGGRRLIRPGWDGHTD